MMKFCCWQLQLAACKLYGKKKAKRCSPKCWIHPFIVNLDDQGDYRHLIRELRCDPVLFRRYFRMSVDQFDDLLSQIKRRIRLNNSTKFTVHRAVRFVIARLSCRKLLKTLMYNEHYCFALQLRHRGAFVTFLQLICTFKFLLIGQIIILIQTTCTIFCSTRPSCTWVVSERSMTGCVIRLQCRVQNNSVNKESSSGFPWTTSYTQ